MLSSLRRTLAVAVLAAIVIVGIGYALWPRPVPVDLMRVGAGPLEVMISEEGVTRIQDVYLVSAPVAGLLERSRREVGDQVIAHETLIGVIRPMAPTFLDERGRREAEARVRAAKAAEALGIAEVRRAEAELEFARSELERAERLAQSATISQRSLDEARLNVEIRAASLEKASADLAVRREELESARARLIEPTGEDRPTLGRDCCVNVRSPITGEVIKVLVESEQIIEAGTSLVEVGNPDRLEVTVDLLSRDAVRISPGARAVVEGWGGEGQLQARVRRINTAGFTKVSALGIEEQRVQVTLDPVGDLAAWSALGHDYRIHARIVVWESGDVLQVPLSALFRHEDDWAVFRLEDGRATRVVVEIGQRGERTAQVIWGLEAGDSVIVHPSDRVDDGVAVAARQID